MEQEFQKRLYDMEVPPPAAVWEKLSISLDEINEDILVAGKLKNTSVQPPAGLWDNISNSLPVIKSINQRSRGTIYYIKRLAAVAVFTGLIFSAWYLFNNNNKSEGIASEKIQEEKIVLNEVISNLPATENDKNKEPVISNTDNGIITAGTQIQKMQMKKPAIQTPVSKGNFALINNQKPGEKIFKPTAEDLSLVGDGEHYLTLLNANGRLVKITPQMAHLAPQLQDKPVTLDFYEMMFGEGEYWKETLDAWRKQLAKSPVGSGDLFSSLVEMLKSVSKN